MLEIIPYYYLGGKIDYIWTPKDEDTISRLPGTGSVPRFNFTALREWLTNKSGGRIWLLEDPIPIAKVTKHPDILMFLDDIGRCRVYEGRDGQTSVYLFSSSENGQVVCSNDDDKVDKHFNSSSQLNSFHSAPTKCDLG
jgi:hypothetical protein